MESSWLCLGQKPSSSLFELVRATAMLHAWPPRFWAHMSISGHVWRQPVLRALQGACLMLLYDQLTWVLGHIPTSGQARY